MVRTVGAQPTSVVVTVPRHASAETSEELVNEVKKAAESEGKNFLNDFCGAPHTARSRAMDNASEWNSLLISARAARGPQWDVGIQQYLVEKESDLYYDPTPIHQTDDPSAPDGSDPTHGMAGHMMPPNGEVRFGDDSPVERRRTRAGGGF